MLGVPTRLINVAGDNNTKDLVITIVNALKDKLGIFYWNSTRLNHGGGYSALVFVDTFNYVVTYKRVSGFLFHEGGELIKFYGNYNTVTNEIVTLRFATETLPTV